MQLVDCISDGQGELDGQAIAALMQENSIAQLPAIIRQQTPIRVPYVMNLCMLKTSGTTCDIIKHFMFGETLTLENAVCIFHGQPLVIDFGRNHRAGVKPFVYMFQRLGSFQISYARVGLKEMFSSSRTSRVR